MENEELDNELVVENDVEDTSEENLEEVEIDTSEDEKLNQDNAQEAEKSEDDIEKLIEERANKLFQEKVEERLKRDRNSRERQQNKELAKYRQLENVIKAGLGVDNIDDAISQSSEFYRGQGVIIPEYNAEVRTEKEEMILAREDVKEIMDLGMEGMEAEANRISSIPKERRSIREQAVFNELCEKIIDQRQVNELKEKGVNSDILEDNKFKEFKKKFTYDTSISDIYEMYSKLNAKPVEKPASAGSAKSDVGKTNETFTPESINKMTPQEIMKYWNNPAFRKVAGLN